MTGGGQEKEEKQDTSEFAQLALRDYRESVLRRQWLFWGVAAFLVIDALVFFVALCWASWAIAYKDGDWHLYASALLPGALGAVIAVMALKAVYRMPKQESLQMEDMAPGYETWKGVASDLSGD